MAAHLLFSHEDEGGEATGGHVSTEWWRDEEDCWREGEALGRINAEKDEG